MRGTARWIGALAACAAVGAALALVDWLAVVGWWGVMAGCFAIGLFAGPRAIRWVLAGVVGATVVAVAQIDPNAYTDFEEPDATVLIGIFVALLLASVAAIGALVRWIAARATSRRTSD